MRGSRARLDERGDGEIDENFWAQAAADQAAGQNGEIDESTHHFYPTSSLSILTERSQPKAVERFPSTPNSSTTTLTMLLGSMTYMMVTVVRQPSSNPVNRISWLLLPVRQDESDRSMSTMPSERREWMFGNSRKIFGRTLRSSFLRRKRKKTKTLIWYVLFSL